MIEVAQRRKFRDQHFHIAIHRVEKQKEKFDEFIRRIDWSRFHWLRRVDRVCMIRCFRSIKKLSSTKVHRCWNTKRCHRPWPIDHIGGKGEISKKVIQYFHFDHSHTLLGTNVLRESSRVKFDARGLVFFWRFRNEVSSNQYLPVPFCLTIDRWVNNNVKWMDKRAELFGQNQIWIVRDGSSSEEEERIKIVLRRPPPQTWLDWSKARRVCLKSFEDDKVLIYSSSDALHETRRCCCQSQQIKNQTNKIWMFCLLPSTCQDLIQSNSINFSWSLISFFDENIEVLI